jgi:long-chain fatty acid transport protein
MRSQRNLVLALAVAAAVAAPAAFATNGMNMQGYGPIAYGMGGASMAYDNGVAAVMNNPATLGLMSPGSRFDLAYGYLGPNVDAKIPGDSESSDATTYHMPAVGYARKDGKITYGVGVFAQGGMGTQYSKKSFLAMGSGDEVGAQLGMGRLLFPIAFNASPDVSIGATIDYVWASLDLSMAATGAQLAGLVTDCSGSACAALPALAGLPWVRLDFTDGDFMDFGGKAQGAGFAGKIGVTWKASPVVSLGATYHTETNLGDLETGGSTLTGAGMGELATGQIKVRDFQWPATMAVGLAWNASKDVMVVADIKKIYWSEVMKDFEMTYKSKNVAGAGGATIDFALQQDWDDQTVYQVGAAWKVSDPLTLRAGYNYAESQIPDDFVNPLFPAIMEQHFTVGLGYAFDKSASLDAGLAYAPQNSQKNADGVESSTGGTSFQVMYSARF